MPEVKVENISKGQLDSTGVPILTVYALNPQLYAVYGTAERVIVQYADAPDTALAQRKSLAPLNPIRGEINGLINGWRGSRQASAVSKAARYDRRVADALIVALEDSAPSAASLLDDIKADLTNERTSTAQFLYLTIALGAVLFSIALAALLACRPLGCMTDGIQTTPLWLATGAGAVGAFFSIANGIRTRTVLTDLHMGSNAVDSVLRVTIGIIAAPLAVCLLASGLVTFNLGGVAIGGHTMAGNGFSWMLVLVVGFIAGFSERLIPDLLAKASAVAVSAGGAGAGLEKASAAATATGGSPAADRDQLDACLTDHSVTPAEATADEDLPAAKGGVESTS